MHMHPMSNFISIEVAVQELGGPPPPLGQGVDQKHLGRTRAKNDAALRLFFKLISNKIQNKSKIKISGYIYAFKSVNR